MKILERRELWIHTHFLTDCQKLSTYHMRRIKTEIEGYLRSIGIVYGIHYEARPRERGIRIVLECIPIESTMRLVEDKLRELVRPVPIRPIPARARVAEGGTGRQRATDARASVAA